MGILAHWRANREFTFQVAKNNLPPDPGPGFVSIPASSKSMLFIVAAIRQALNMVQTRAGGIRFLVLSFRV